MFKWGLINKKAGWARLDYSPLPAPQPPQCSTQGRSRGPTSYIISATPSPPACRPPTTPPNTTSVWPTKTASMPATWCDSPATATESQPPPADTVVRAPGAELKQADAELEAIGETVDMVSAFYYACTMPFAKMAPGQQRIINIFSAKKRSASPSPLPEQRPSGSTTAPTTPIISNSASPPTAASSRATTSTPGWRRLRPHRPVKLEGKLKIGKIMCLLEP